MDTEEKEEKRLQWHPAFYAGLQIELEEEREQLIFENEHQLSTKPLSVDALVIKKQRGVKLKKNIGRIFRGHNIIEYKSPKDSLNIDDFYKVYGYACFYKADSVKVNAIEAEDITLTFVVKRFPHKLLRELERTRGIRIVKAEEGIYYLEGEIFPIQLIHTEALSEENNFWLKYLTDDLKREEDAENLLCAYERRKDELLCQSVMDVIVKANKRMFKEVDGMCDALMEIVKPKVDAKIQEAVQEAVQKAVQETEKEAVKETKLSLIQKLAKGLSVEKIAELLEEPEAEIRELMAFLA